MNLCQVISKYLSRPAVTWGWGVCIRHRRKESRKTSHLSSRNQMTLVLEFVTTAKVKVVYKNGPDMANGFQPQSWHSVTRLPPFCSSWLPTFEPLCILSSCSLLQQRPCASLLGSTQRIQHCPTRCASCLQFQLTLVIVGIKSFSSILQTSWGTLRAMISFLELSNGTRSVSVYWVTVFPACVVR